MRIFSGRLGSREAVCMWGCVFDCGVGVRACLLFLSSIYRAVFVLLFFFFLFSAFFYNVSCLFSRQSVSLDICLCVAVTNVAGSACRWCRKPSTSKPLFPLPPTTPPFAHYFLFELAVGGTRSLGALFEVVWLLRCSDLRCIGFSSPACRLKLKKLVQVGMKWNWVEDT